MATNRKWVFLFAVAAVLAWVGSAAFLYGQKTTGSIQGTATDTTGAVIPGVKIAVTNTATNVSATTTTSSEGTYLVSNLDPSTYVVTAEHPGFERQVQQGGAGSCSCGHCCGHTFGGWRGYSVNHRAGSIRPHHPRHGRPRNLSSGQHPGRSSRRAFGRIPSSRLVCLS